MGERSDVWGGIRSYRALWGVGRYLDSNLSIRGAIEGFYEGKWQYLTSALMTLLWLLCVCRVSRIKAMSPVKRL